MITEFSQELYRYDLNQPPKKLDSNFKNYEYSYEQLGNKNKADLFFFTDSIDIVRDLAKKATSNESKGLWYLTTINVGSTLKLIDFSDCANIFQMINLLNTLNIDVLTKDFKTFEGDNTFELLKEYFNNAIKEENPLKIINYVTKLKVHSQSNHFDISLFGQRLTDFDNGLKFKKILKELYPDVDGYRWQEFNDNRGLSYCLLNPDKISIANTKVINEG